MAQARTRGLDGPQSMGLAMELTAVFETWHLGDGNYPPLHKGQLVKLSFELEPSSLSKSSGTAARFEQIKDAEYKFVGTVLKVYSDPPDGQMIVIQAGGFRFYVSFYPKGTVSLQENESVQGHGRLLLDHYLWVEFLSTYPDHPDLFYSLRVARIRSVRIPDSFISRGETVVSGPASLTEEEYSTSSIEEVDRMQDVEGNWRFYLVDFETADVESAKIPLTFRS
jgi:hypothetical protein